MTAGLKYNHFYVLLYRYKYAWLENRDIFSALPVYHKAYWNTAIIWRKALVTMIWQSDFNRQSDFNVHV